MEPNTRSSAITIDASAAAVWTVLADEFVDIAAWSPGVKSSGPNPATPQGVNGSRYGGRVADIEGLGHTDVRITAYDFDTLTLSYTVEAENIPPSSRNSRTPGPLPPMDQTPPHSKPW
jgi:hypothetical protein